MTSGAMLAFSERGLRVIAIAGFAALVTACSASKKPSISPPVPCDATARRDALAILGTDISPRVSGRPLPDVDYTLTFVPGVAYIGYSTTSGTCRLAHLDVRWKHRDKPLVLSLSGGNLRRVELRMTARNAEVIVDDRWRRRLETTLPDIPDGLTLWGDDGPLHAAIGGRWQTEAGPDILVRKTGPMLFQINEGEDLPLEWDVSAKRYVDSPGVYSR